jgi:hypothetical protein
MMLFSWLCLSLLPPFEKATRGPSLKSVISSLFLAASLIVGSKNARYGSHTVSEDAHDCLLLCPDLIFGLRACRVGIAHHEFNGGQCPPFSILVKRYFLSVRRPAISAPLAGIFRSCEKRSEGDGDGKTKVGNQTNRRRGCAVMSDSSGSGNSNLLPGMYRP